MNYSTADVGGTADVPGQVDDSDRSWLAGGLVAAPQAMPSEGALTIDAEDPMSYLEADESVGLARLPFVGAAISRRVLFWCVAAVIGLCLGAGVYAVHPPGYEASTSVLVTQNPALNPLDAVQTDVALAQSRSVAGPVLNKLGLDENVAKFIGSYTVVAVTDRVLVFTVSAPSSDQAVSRAAALAAEFLRFRARELLQQQQSVVNSLTTALSRAKHLTATISGEIATVSAWQSSSAQQVRLYALKTRLHQATTALEGLQHAEASYQASGQVTAASMIAGSRVLDSAAALPRSKVRSPVVYAVGGALAGLLAGIAIVIIQELVSDRLRRRDDIAVALGAPVELSVRRPPRHWPRGLAAAQGQDMQRIVKYLRGVIVHARTGNTPALAIVALDEPRSGALSVASLALALAADGKRVMVADLAAGAPAARLLGVRTPGVAVATSADRQLTVAVPPRADFARIGPVERARIGADGHSPAGFAVPDELAVAYGQADLLITLVTLDPALGTEYLPTWAVGAVVMLTAGESSGTKIHTAGEMIRLAGTRLISAILLDADKADESLGMRLSPASELAADSPSAFLSVP